MATRTALIVGGSSGLGLELALLLAADHRVVVTGRRDPHRRDLEFFALTLDTASVSHRLDELLGAIGNVDLLVYAAGFRQEGKIDALTDDALLAMAEVGLLVPALLVQRIVKKQSRLEGLIAVTSTSQWTPRLLEPMYTAVKAGLAMLANSLSLDPRVGKVLVAGPAGMTTRFWEGSSRDISGMLDPRRVAEQVLNLYADQFRYRFARILRNPPGVEIGETRLASPQTSS